MLQRRFMCSRRQGALIPISHVLRYHQLLCVLQSVHVLYLFLLRDFSKLTMGACTDSKEEGPEVKGPPKPAEGSLEVVLFSASRGTHAALGYTPLPRGNHALYHPLIL